MDDLLLKSREIIEKAIRDYQPYAIVLMFSGGNDSRLAYWVLKSLGYDIDAIVHGVTGTGIKECGLFCEKFSESNGERFIVADYGAGDAYVRRLLERGWPGRGQKAHSIAYHILKASPFRKAISRNFRHRKRGRNILLVNGARKDESKNRANNYGDDYYNADPAAKSNIWVNICWDWDDKSKSNFLNEQPDKQGIVPALIHRSGDCMCGTMQSKEEGEEAAYWFPDWANDWWIPTRQAVANAGFTWDWGEHPPKGGKAQLPLFHDFMPACISCKNRITEDV